MIAGSAGAEQLMTAEELLRLDVRNKSTELVRGRLVVREPPGTHHGRVQAKLNFLVAGFVYARGLGAVFGQDTGFRIASNPDTVRAPDLAVVRTERAALIGPRGYAAIAPDFVAEILSHDDRPGEVLTKIGEWLAAGVEIVWLIDPERNVARVYRADGSMTLVAHDGRLEGELLLSGFSCALADVLG